MTSFRWVIACVAGVVMTAGAARAAVVPMTFSGGGGSRLTVGLSEPVTYTVGRESSSGVVFVFQNTGNLTDNYQRGLTSTLTYTINGGAPIRVEFATAGRSARDAKPNDLVMFQFGGGPNVAVGDVIALSAGSATTIENTTFPAPASGSYSTFLADSFFNRIDVPEPASAGVLIAAAGALLARRRAV